MTPSFDPHPSVRIAAAEAVAELDLKDASPYLRQALALLWRRSRE